MTSFLLKREGAEEFTWQVTTEILSDERFLWQDARGDRLGQDANAKGAIGDLLRAGGIGPENLQPIYDRDQRFGAPPQTVLGLESRHARRERGLTVIGAAATGLALSPQWGQKIRHNYEEQMGLLSKQRTFYADAQRTKVASVLRFESPLESQLRFRPSDVPLYDSSPEVRRQVNAQIQRNLHFVSANEYLSQMTLIDLLVHQVDPLRVPGFLQKLERSQRFSTPKRPSASAVASIVGPAQLGAIRAVAAALLSFVPDYAAQGRANLTSDDRTTLFVAQRRMNPDASPETIRNAVEEVIAGRRARERVSPLGYVPSEEAAILNVHKPAKL